MQESTRDLKTPEPAPVKRKQTAVTAGFIPRPSGPLMEIPTSATSLKYRPDIDRLRAVAVLSVLAFHIGLSRTPGGFVGVDVFFVISGYLISSIIFSEIAGSRFSVIRFYERRILPALFANICRRIRSRDC
jgi:hypothetical protein